MYATIVYLVLLAASLAIFSITLFRRIRILRFARSTDRRGDRDVRLGGVVRNVFGQYRLLHGDIAAGVMHFLIFWGFIAVLLNTVHFLIQGPVTEFALPLFGRAQLLGKLYMSVRDVFELLVLLAVGWAAWRRLVLRPRRLSLSGEALLILLLIALLMITDFLLSGTEAALGQIGPEQWKSPAEVVFGAALGGLMPASLWLIEQFSWWIHFAALMYFLNLLPLGKHFHVLLSIPAVYLRRLTSHGELDFINFEDEALEEYGASRLKHFTWKVWFDSYNCTECGRCDYFCPANATGKALSPRHILTGTRDRIYKCQPQILRALAARARGKNGELDPEEGMPELVGEVHTDQELWACTTCGACDEHCPVFLDHVDAIVEMRRHLVLEQEGRFPKELIATFKGLETQGNPWSIGAHQRLDWAEGLDVAMLSDKPDAEYVYFVGCFASLDERNKTTARAFVELLNHAGVSFAVLDGETCCGDPARRCGNEYLAQALMELNAEQFKDGKVRKVVTCCPHCFNTLKHEYYQLGVEFEEVVHHSTLLARLLAGGKLRPTHEAASRRVTFHDSCYLGRYNRIYYQPRDVLRSVHGLQLVEPSYHHDKGYCCGAGGGMMFMEETEGTRVNQFRLGQLRQSQPDAIAVACPFCMTMLDDAVKEAELDYELPVEDIAVTLHKSILG